MQIKRPKNSDDSTTLTSLSVIKKILGTFIALNAILTAPEVLNLTKDNEVFAKARTVSTAIMMVAGAFGLHPLAVAEKERKKLGDIQGTARPHSVYIPETDEEEKALEAALSGTANTVYQHQPSTPEMPPLVLD